jgi:D-alanine-D-alanine ligase
VGRIAVAYNDDAHLKSHLNEFERLGEAEVFACAKEAAELLDADMVAVGCDIRAALRHLGKFDVVVDYCEGVLGSPRYEMNFALALEMVGIAHTSCDPMAVAICSDKILIKRLLLAGGLPTPRGYTSPSEAPPGRYIIKPSLEDAGIGIDPGAVVHTPSELSARFDYIAQRYGQAPLIEEFIEGRELNQSVYLGKLLPVGEVVFADHLAASERVVGWKAKWANGSAEDLATRNQTPACIDSATQEQITRICLTAVELLGLDMTARFDLRQSSRTGVIYIVDVNPNPDLGSSSGFRKALDAAGISFSDLLEDLIIAGCARRSR